MADLFWLIPLVPGVSAFALLLFGRRLSRRWIAWQASSAVFLSFALTAAAFAHLGAAGAAGLSRTLLTWIVSGSLEASISFTFDELTAVMALVVTGVGFLIHVYSAAYMAEDRAYSRYFAFLNLFTFFMLVLVMASDIVLMFVGWEGVGLCSYLLIGFWFERPAAAKAGMKAFIVNRDRRRGLHHRHPLPPGQRRELELGRDQRRARRGPTRPGSRHASSPSSFSSERRGNRPRSRSTSGCPTPWKARRPSAPSSTPRPWSRPASIWSAA